MPKEQLKPLDKVVLKMTKDGAVEENLTTGKVDRVSARLEFHSRSSKRKRHLILFLPKQRQSAVNLHQMVRKRMRRSRRNRKSLNKIRTSKFHINRKRLKQSKTNRKL